MELIKAPFKELKSFAQQQIKKYDPTTDTFANYFGRFSSINTLYENPISKAGQMVPARIGKFIIFGQTSESINIANKLPTHPLARDGVMSDHVFHEPITVSVSGLVSEIDSNVLEEAWMSGRIQSMKSLLSELQKNGISTVDALRRVVSGYQKRKHIVNLLYEIAHKSNDVRYTYASNLLTLTHMAIQSIAINQSGEDRPMEVSFNLIQVKEVKIDTVEADYFTGMKRKSSVYSSKNVGDSSVSPPKNICDENISENLRSNILRGVFSVNYLKTMNLEKCVDFIRAKKS